MSRDVRSICVYCASSTQIDENYFAAAKQLGRLMGLQGIQLVNGAGNLGLMRAAADGCMEVGGTTVGVIPSFMIRENWCYNDMTEIVETPDMHTRQEKMAELSDAAIVLPGGCGTIAEFMELVTWKQLGLYLNPIVVLNTNGYFDTLLESLHQAVEQHFMRPQHTDIWKVAQTPEEALCLALSTPLWDASIRKIAAI